MYCTVATQLFCVYANKTITVVFQVEKLESECSQLQQELQDSKDQNELLEFRILELEVSSLPTLLFRSCILGFSLVENNTESTAAVNWFPCFSRLLQVLFLTTGKKQTGSPVEKLQKLKYMYRSKMEKGFRAGAKTNVSLWKYPTSLSMAWGQSELGYVINVLWWIWSVMAQ